ncbi:galanin-like peptide isoform X1 [Leptonychotes weddellii]|uniref:Galanin-like peptide n=1 Tax=Leptonychotes weddellii TaxID=9713 RepID=A0A7F8PVP2_LEPWE|nr:galanin-like peptide isoform X1 [Leptonychotes weddellii]
MPGNEDGSKPGSSWSHSTPVQGLRFMIEMRPLPSAGVGERGGDGKKRPVALSVHPSGPQMAPSVHLVLLLAVLLSLGETPASVPVHQGRGGWTLNSVGYLLGPVLHLPRSADHGGKEKTALEVLDLWKAVDGLPYPRPQRASKRSLRETFAKAETADLGKLSEKAPKEGDALRS